MSFAAFQSAAAKAADLVRSKPKGTRWFLACDTDADGLCSAAVAAAALAKAGHRFTIRASRDKTAAAYTALFDVDADGLVMLDKGSSHLGLLAAEAQRTGRPVIVLDHHNVVGETEGPSIVVVNPRSAGLDGSRDASAATTSVAFAIALCGDAALPWAAIGLSGAIGDWQHVPDWKGWNFHLLEESRKAGHVRDVPQPHFIGVTLAEAVARFRPPIPGLHGDLPAATAFLEGLGIASASEAEELDQDARTRLVSACALRLVAAGRPDDAKALVVPVEQNAKHGTSLRHVFRIVDACGREGEAATGIAFLLGDKAAKVEALLVFARYKAILHDSLRVLVEKGTIKRRAVQVAWTENPDYTGMVGGLGMEHIVADRARPLAVLARRPDGKVQVSTRGKEALVKKGLDLGAACQRAAAAVGAEGGGHPVAAGAVVEEAKVEAFLAALDEALVAQRFVEAQ